MRSIFKIVTSSIIIILCLFFAGCSSEAKKTGPVEPADVSNPKIAEQMESFQFSMSNERNITGGRKISFKKFSGFYTLDTVNLKAGSKVTLNYSSKISSGKFSLVVFDTDYKEIKVLEANKEDSYEFNAEKEGKYTIKIVGEEAAGQAQVTWKK